MEISGDAPTRIRALNSESPRQSADYVLCRSQMYRRAK
jgi:hypothetical protein